MKRICLIAILLWLTGLYPVHAQLWSGILAPSRAIDWAATSPGVVGGVPSAAWPQCSTTACVALASAGATATAAQINAAIASAPSHSYVYLSPGTYTLSSGILMSPNVALRGAGPDQTFLVFSDGTACNGEGSQICAKDALNLYYGSPQVAPGGTNSATFCGTGTSVSCSGVYTPGATSIQLSSIGSKGIKNGQFLYLDQVDDNPSAPSTTNTTGLMVCDKESATDGCSLQRDAPGRCSQGNGGAACASSGGVDRNQVQIVQVVSGCSSTCLGRGPYPVTITPGLYGRNWRSSQSPGAWWSDSTMQNVGIENLSIDSTQSTRPSSIMFSNAFNCWVNNVRSINPYHFHVWIWQSAHITVQNSYFYGTQNATSSSYGIESFIASDNLVVNNIFQKVTSPVTVEQSTGSVFAYNFAVNDYYFNSSWLMQGFVWRHDAGSLFNLSEGNLTSGYIEDVFHGTGGMNTAFRNYAVGWESGKTSNIVPVVLLSYNRFENFIGNVLGCNNTTSAYPGNCGAPRQKTYSTNLYHSAPAAIFALGAGNTGTNSSGATNVVQPDPYVVTSLMRWGNYDVANGSVRWVPSEVPSSLTDGYANPVPQAQSLPASFWTTAKPSWWGSNPWPGIGPDVSGGSVPGVGGHVCLNPAATCYLNILSGPADGSGNVLTFNSNNCKVTPTAPSGLVGTVH